MKWIFVKIYIRSYVGNFSNLGVFYNIEGKFLHLKEEILIFFLSKGENVPFTNSKKNLDDY